MKVIWQEVIHKWKFLDYTLLDVEKNNGTVWKYEMVTRGKEVVSALIENVDTETYIFIEQFRPPVRWKVLGLVAWVCDKEGKNLEEIIQEEVVEESGYPQNQIQSIDFISRWPKSAWMSDEIGNTYHIKVNGERWEQKLESTEDINVLEIKKEEIDDFIKERQQSWELISPEIYTALYYVKNLADDVINNK